MFDSAETLTPSDLTLDNSLSTQLLESVTRLRFILPVISVSVMALRRQDAEADVDVASVLTENACLPLDSEIERLESILASRLTSPRQKEART